MKKNIITKSLFIILFLSFLFSCSKESKLEQALELAGENRIEHEKVLKHYSKNSKDRLKLKAAKFLIENMDAHFFYVSPELEAYYGTLDSIFSLNERYENLTKEQKTLLNKLEIPDPKSFKIVPDLQHVFAEFLIDNNATILYSSTALHRHLQIHCLFLSILSDKLC